MGSRDSPRSPKTGDSAAKGPSSPTLPCGCCHLRVCWEGEGLAPLPLQPQGPCPGTQALSLLLQDVALTDARLRCDPGEPQVEDHTPDVEHASDLGGRWGDKFPEMPKVKLSRACSQAWGHLMHLMLSAPWDQAGQLGSGRGGAVYIPPPPPCHGGLEWASAFPSFTLFQAQDPVSARS